MMVVIGIIAILGAVVVPGFKKAYSEFKINETYALLDSLFSSLRSYYLIYNEQHGISGGPWGAIDERLLPFLTPTLRKFAPQYIQTNYGYRWWTFRLDKGLYLFYKGTEVYTLFVRKYFCFDKERLGDRVIDRLYYLDDLLKRYQKKGYNAYTNSSSVYVRPPEWTDTKWFR